MRLERENERWVFPFFLCSFDSIMNERWMHEWMSDECWPESAQSFCLFFPFLEDSSILKGTPLPQAAPSIPHVKLIGELKKLYDWKESVKSVSHSQKFLKSSPYRKITCKHTVSWNEMDVGMSWHCRRRGRLMRRRNGKISGFAYLLTSRFRIEALNLRGPKANILFGALITFHSRK